MCNRCDRKPNRAERKGEKGGKRKRIIDPEGGWEAGGVNCEAFTWDEHIHGRCRRISQMRPPISLLSPRLVSISLSLSPPNSSISYKSSTPRSGSMAMAMLLCSGASGARGSESELCVHVAVANASAAFLMMTGPRRTARGGCCCCCRCRLPLFSGSGDAGGHCKGDLI